MFDILKKLNENQDNGELNTEEPCENAEEKVTVEELKEELDTQEPYQSEEEKILSMLETLEDEEQALLAEKSQLLKRARYKGFWGKTQEATFHQILVFEA